MINAELSTEFDVLYNNITSNQAPGLNDYEKSVFLTKAEFQLVSEYFNRKLDSSEGGFDGSSKRQIDFSSIIEWKTLEKADSVDKFDIRSIAYYIPEDVLFPINEQLSVEKDTDIHSFYSVVPISYDDYDRLMAKPYKFPPKNQAWRLITKSVTIPAKEEIITTYFPHTIYASAISDNTEIFKLSFKSKNDTPIRIALVTEEYFEGKDSLEETYSVIELNSDLTIESLYDVLKGYVEDLHIESNYELDNIKSFWKTGIILLIESEASNSYSETKITKSKTSNLLEIIGKFSSDPIYKMRYVRRPKPIILSDLSGLGVSLEGLTEEQECELPEEMHHEILERAVTLAKLAWQGATMTQTALAVQASK